MALNDVEHCEACQIHEDVVKAVTDHMPDEDQLGETENDYTFTMAGKADELHRSCSFCKTSLINVLLKPSNLCLVITKLA